MNNLLASLKEAALQAALKNFINQEIEGIGVVTDCVIDTSRKTIQMKLELKGETSPIEINADEYELSEQDGGVHLALRKISTSREWITGLLNKYVASRNFRLPNAARMLL